MGFTRFLLLVFCAALSVNCASSACSTYRKGPQTGGTRVITDKLTEDKQSVAIGLNPKKVIGTYVSGLEVKACSEKINTDDIHIAYENGEITVKDIIIWPSKAEIDITVVAYLTAIAPPFQPPLLDDGLLEHVKEK